jgi:diguanylate cyclase (GGDEF)-like protein
MFDIDHFKTINDRFGHQAGDSVLVALAERMRGLMRAYDMVSRWSGKEFIVLLPDTHLNGACRILERLRAEIAAMGIPEVGRVTCSFGVGLINRQECLLFFPPFFEPPT